MARFWSVTASVLGMSDRDREGLHRRYFGLLVEQILADGFVSEQERRLHAQVATALEIEADELPMTSWNQEPTRPPGARPLEPGTKVCFTGSAAIEGRSIKRSELERMASTAGLQVVGAVTADCRIRCRGRARRARHEAAVFP